MLIFFALSFGILFQLHCEKPHQTAVEAIEGDRARTLPFSFSSLDGSRDGARVNATLVMKSLENRDRLLIKLVIDLGPPIRLGSGTFQLIQSDRILVGPVNALSLNFQAGQSGGMSLGGRFELLNSSGNTVYRVVLPQTLVESNFR